MCVWGGEFAVLVVVKKLCQIAKKPQSPMLRFFTIHIHHIHTLLLPQPHSQHHLLL